MIFEKTTQPEVERRFEEIAARDKHLSSTKFIDALNKAIVSLVTEFVDKWRYEEEAKVKDKFNAGVEELFSRMNELIDDVYQHAAALFEVEFQRVENYPLFSDETEFYYFILEDIKPSLEELSDAIVKMLPRWNCQTLNSQKRDGHTQDRIRQAMWKGALRFHKADRQKHDEPWENFERYGE